MKGGCIMKKFVLILIFCIAVIHVSIFSAFAYGKEVLPLWDNIESIHVDISFNGNNGNALGIVINQPNVSFVEGVLAIYELSNGDWVLVDATYKESSNSIYSISLDFLAQSQTEYKAEFEIISYKDGSPETVNSTTFKRCP